IPSSLATWATLPPAASTISTASALNSGVNFRRLLVDMTDSFRARRRNHQVSVKPGQHQASFGSAGFRRIGTPERSQAAIRYDQGASGPPAEEDLRLNDLPVPHGAELRVAIALARPQLVFVHDEDAVGARVDQLADLLRHEAINRWGSSAPGTQPCR